MKAALKETDKKPDIVLVYLKQDHHHKGAEHILPNKIENLKEIWPGVYIIAIISDPRQREGMRTSGADEVLFEGITAARLLASIEKVELVD